MTSEFVIYTFRGENEFMSNFHEVAGGFPYVGMTWRTSEAAFQAGKTDDIDFIRRINEAATPGEAKKLGRKAPLRPTWEKEKRFVMLDVLLAKFAEPYLQKKLIETGSKTLIEGNYWGDTYWGLDLRTGAGTNHLGELLMLVRDFYAKEPVHV